MSKTSKMMWIWIGWSLSSGCGAGEVDRWSYPGGPANSPGAICGNGDREAGETCDGAALSDETCSSLGFDTGLLRCNARCDDFDRADCGPPLETDCGDGAQEGVEQCDGAELSGETCESLGYGPGKLSCLANCAGFDTSDCGVPPTCGDKRRNGIEVCDDHDFGGLSCGALGLGEGSLSCALDCLSFATSDCGPPCEPDCTGRVCGPDPVCGQSCGICPAGTCSAEGVCVEQSVDGPVFLSFTSNTNVLTPGTTLILSVVATDPDGVADLIGGTVEDPAGGTYGSLSATGGDGTYAMSLTWDAINVVQPIQAEVEGSPRTFRARVFDQAGHEATRDLSLTVSCGDGVTSACAGNCLDLQTEAAHCGQCDRDCGARGCQAGHCGPVILATDQDDAVGIALDDTYLYWAEHEPGRLHQKPLAGGAATLLPVRAATFPWAVAVRNEKVYWTTNEGIYTCPRDGTTPAVQLSSYEGQPFAIAVDDSGVYWISPYYDRVRRWSEGVVSTLVETASDPFALALGADVLYWTDTTSVSTSNKDGGTAATLVPNQGDPTGLAINGDWIYWATTTVGSVAGTIAKKALAGGPVTVLADDQEMPQDLVVDGTHVYWVDSGSAGVADGAVRRVPSAGGSVETLAAQEWDPRRLVVNDEWVYWTTESEVRAIEK